MQAAGNEVLIPMQTAMSKADIPMQQNQVVIMDALVSPEPIKVKVYYLHTAEGLKLSYNVEVFNNETNDWWNVRVNALNGDVLEKNNWTVHCAVSGQTFSHEGSDMSTAATQSMLSATATAKMGKTNVPIYNVVPFPFESPNHSSRVRVSGQEHGNASPFGWHDIDGVDGAEYTTTKGNNVFAAEDTLAANGSGFSPEGCDSMVFDFPMDTTWMNPNTYLSAAITNLFYWNNIVHDVFYNYGFHEAAGNYQKNNYSKGGSENDQVMADAQDGNGVTNANFRAPVDGQNGRMQMYLWPTTTVVASPITISNSPTANGNYTAPLSAFGPKHFGDITAKVVWVRDGSAADTLGCNTLTNAAQLAGNIALIYRGTCNSAQKVLNAQNAGAVAVIVVSTSNTASAMQGSGAIKIPSVIVSSTDGAKIRAALRNGDTVMATLKGLPVVKAYDSDFDNGVIVHEFGHGISIRLTGGPSNSSCLNNAEQGGEGWSDFFALALTAKVTDSANSARGMGTFVYNQTTSALGIRDFKYSRNMKVNPMTYSYLKNNSEVHYIGTVWCTMLWDMYWNMVDKYGFDPDIYNGTGGNNKAIQLVIDGLKLQPCSPGFVDAHNAILKADSINNGGANKDVIWRAFARRGLGYSAVQGTSSSTTDGTAAFDLPPGVTGVETASNLAAYIQLAPNPTTGTAVLVLPDQLTKGQLTIFDITGKIVIDEVAFADMNKHISIDVSAFQNGLYFVKLVSGSTSFQSKLMLQK